MEFNEINLAADELRELCICLLLHAFLIAFRNFVLCVMLYSVLVPTSIADYHKICVFLE